MYSWYVGLRGLGLPVMTVGHWVLRTTRCEGSNVMALSTYGLGGTSKILVVGVVSTCR